MTKHAASSVRTRLYFRSECCTMSVYHSRCLLCVEWTTDEAERRAYRPT